VGQIVGAAAGKTAFGRFRHHFRYHPMAVLLNHRVRGDAGERTRTSTAEATGS
jgi:hypothetical protein